MKKLLMILCVFFCCQLSANPWFEHWERGLEYKKAENYVAAIEEYTRALEGGIFQENYHVRYDRAMAFMMIKEYDSALIDLDIFLEKENLRISDVLWGKMLKFSALSLSGRKEECYKIYDEAQSINCNLPILEKYENTVVVRNVPECKCTQKIMEKVYLALEFCESVDKIRKFDTVWIMYRKPCNKCKEPCEPKKKECKCGCQDGAKASLDFSESLAYKRDTLPGPAPLPGDREREKGNTVEECNERCDRVTRFAKEMCDAWFAKFSCRVACALAAEGLLGGCKWCCSNGDFWEKCIKPFDFLKEMIQCPGDTAWDP